MSEDLAKKIVKMPGVTGVSIEGDKIIVFAEEGYSYDTIEGHKVTCLKAGKVDSLELSVGLEYGDSLRLREETWRPIPGGVSGAHIGTSAGTIGMKVTRDGVPYLLSNTHIFGQKLGTPILQPSPLDGGTDNDRIGECYDYVPIKYDGDNEVDAALCSLDYIDEAAENVLDLGVVKGVEQPRILMGVEKSGRTTGITHGRIIGTNGYFKVHYEGKGEAYFSGAIITNHMGEPGDSGSILVHNGRAVGLLFAGSRFVTLYIPFWKVKQALEIEVGE